MKHLDYFSLKLFTKYAKNKYRTYVLYETVPVFAIFVDKIKFAREQRLDRLKGKNAKSTEFTEKRKVT